MRIVPLAFEFEVPRFIGVEANAIVLKKTSKPKWLKIIGQGLVVSSLSLFFCLDAMPVRSEKADDLETIPSAEITQRKREELIQWHSGDKNDQSWNPVSDKQFLRPNNWLATGIGAAVKYLVQLMWFQNQQLVYRQKGSTHAQFAPNNENPQSSQICGFRIQKGKALYADAKNPNPAKCRRDIRSGNTTVEFPEGFDPSSSTKDLNPTKNPTKDVDTIENEESVVALFVFRNQDAKETIVGVLASQLGLVRVTNDNREAPDCSEENSQDPGCLSPGEYVFVSDDGKIRKGEFSLQHFYENNLLGYGLGEDPEYVESLPPGSEKRRLFEKIRQATLQALREQPVPGPFELRTTNSPSFRSFKTFIDLPSFPGEIPTQETTDPEGQEPGGTETTQTGFQLI